MIDYVGLRLAYLNVSNVCSNMLVSLLLIILEGLRTLKFLLLVIVATLLAIANPTFPTCSQNMEAFSVASSEWS